MGFNNRPEQTETWMSRSQLLQNILVYIRRHSVTVHNEPDAGWTLLFPQTVECSKVWGGRRRWGQDTPSCWLLKDTEAEKHSKDVVGMDLVFSQLFTFPNTLNLWPFITYTWLLSIFRRMLALFISLMFSLLCSWLLKWK